MKLAHASALYAAPIPLRLVLALTFIWAGLGKIIHEVPVQGEQAALLANMGYDFSNSTPVSPGDAESTPNSKSSSDQAEETAPASLGHPASREEMTMSELEDVLRKLREHAATPVDDSIVFENPYTGEKETLRELTQSLNERMSELKEEPSQESDTELPPLLAVITQDDSDANTDGVTSSAQVATPTYTAADFPDPIEVKSLYNLAILTYNAAHPTPDADGNTPPPIWPEWAARDDWPRYMAWAAAIVELLAGILIALGLITRLSAFSLAGIMLTAAWLTELGPAIQSGDTLLGFLPNHDPWDIHAWRPLLWQCSLFGAALALTLTGPGAIALDRVPTDPDLDDDDDDDDDTE